MAERREVEPEWFAERAAAAVTRNTQMMTVARKLNDALHRMPMSIAGSASAGFDETGVTLRFANPIEAAEFAAWIERGGDECDEPHVADFPK